MNLGRRLFSLKPCTVVYLYKLYCTSATTMCEKALAQGSFFPPMKRDTLRLYSMRFCPYAQRTRLVLAHKKIDHEVVNVNLKYKPDWFLERNPVGLVPILECNDQVVYESVACDEFLDDKYPQQKLTPADPYNRARHRMLMEVFGQVTSAFLTQYRPRFTEEQRVKGRAKLKSLFDIYERELNGKYFGGQDVSMLDLHIWPWFERMSVFSREAILDPAQYPKLNQWMNTMWTLPAVQETMFPVDMHAQFIGSLLQRNPQYDIGLTSANM